MRKLLLETQKLEHSLNKLNYYIESNPNRYDSLLIDAVIKRFEITFQLLCKTFRIYFLIKGLDLHYPKDLLKEAYLGDFLDDEIMWLRMFQDMTIAGFSYDDELANAFFKRIIEYIPALTKTAAKISKIAFEISFDA